MKKLMIILLLLLASICGATEKIPDDSTDRVVFFIAVDATDLFTRETALDTFTVYYVLDNGSATVMTTPTTVAIDDTNMPGLYSLAIDEAGMTNMDAGNDFETLTLHITHASMSPVTMKVEVYRPKITTARTLGIDAGGALSVCTSVTAVAANGIESGSIAEDAINAAALKADALTAIESEANDALVDLNLDHLLKITTGVVADGDLSNYVVDQTVMSHLLTTTADTDKYKASTDSLEANRAHADTIKAETASIKTKTDALPESVWTAPNAKPRTRFGD